MLKIEPRDTGFEIALKIFEHLENHASCVVGGWERNADGEDEPKGEVVIREMIQLDIDKNCRNGKRRRVRADNQIGDYVAQKAFKWAKRTVDGKMRYDIWRIQ